MTNVNLKLENFKLLKTDEHRYREQNFQSVPSAGRLLDHSLQSQVDLD